MSVTRPQHLPYVCPTGAVMLHENVCDVIRMTMSVTRPQHLPYVCPAGTVMLHEDCM